MKCRFCENNFRTIISGVNVILECHKCVHSFKVPRNATLAEVMVIYHREYPDEEKTKKDREVAVELYGALMVCAQTWGADKSDSDPVRGMVRDMLKKYENYK